MLVRSKSLLSLALLSLVISPYNISYADDEVIKEEEVIEDYSQEDEDDDDEDIEFFAELDQAPTNKRTKITDVFTFEADVGFYYTNSRQKPIQEEKTKASLIYTKTEFGVGLDINPAFSVEMAGVIEFVGDLDYRSNGNLSFFSDQALLIEELKAVYSVNNDYSVYFGKFELPFGFAIEAHKDFLQEELVADYELVGKVGIGANLLFQSERLGDYEFDLSVFRNDTSLFNGSLGTDIHEGLTNSEVYALTPAGHHSDLASYNFFLSTGDNFLKVKGLKVGVGYRSLAIDAAVYTEAKKETGRVISGEYTHTISEDLAGELVVEYSDFQNFEGTEGRDVSFFTVAAEGELSLFSFGGQYTKIKIDEFNPDNSQGFREVSEDRYSLFVAYKIQEALLVKGLYSISKNSVDGDVSGFTVGVEYSF